MAEGLEDLSEEEGEGDEEGQPVAAKKKRNRKER